MEGKSKFQIHVEELLLKYINRFVRYAKFSHIPQDRRELLAGTFLYLLDENDLIPDDVPNIGYLDDLFVFFSAAQHFTSSGEAIPGVCNPDELAEDGKFLDKNKGLLFGAQIFSPQAIRKKGRDCEDLVALAQKIKEKYQHLGKVE